MIVSAYRNITPNTKRFQPMASCQPTLLKQRSGDTLSFTAQKQDNTSFPRLNSFKIPFAMLCTLLVSSSAMPSENTYIKGFPEVASATKPLLTAVEEMFGPLLIPKSTKNPVVAINPGHGGLDPGACVGNTTEKALNLDIALKLKAYLENQGVTVVMTRKTDEENDSLQDIKEEINAAKADASILIHNNALPKGREATRGTVSFYNSSNPDSQALAKQVQEVVLEAFSEEAHSIGEGVKNAEETRAQYINDLASPAVLTEVGIMTNEADLKKLQDEDFRQEVAEKTALGIIEFLMQEGKY